VPTQPVLAVFAARTALLWLAILFRFEGLLAARRGAKPVRLIRSGAIWLGPAANRRGFGSWRLEERLVVGISTIAL